MNLRFSQVTKSLGSTRVIDGVNQDVVGARSLVLVGPSGGGKSTLLRLVAGLIQVDEGVIELNGRAVPKEAESLREYRSKLGVVFQSLNLFPHLTAEENVMLPLTVVHGQPKEEAREKAVALLGRFQLGPHRSKKPFQLSGGQRQRVAIARALGHRPQLLLLDEPTSALDPEMTGEVLDVIGELKSNAVDFVLVTHEMGFARQVGDEVWFLSEGKIVESGHPEAVFNRPKHEVTQRFLERVLKY